MANSGNRSAKLRALAGALTGAAALCFVTAFAHAQTTASPSTESRLAELERQMSAMQGSDAAYTTSATVHLPAPSGEYFFGNAHRTGGWVFGAELLFLKPMATGGDLPGKTLNLSADFGDVFSISTEVSNPYGFETSPRFWFGYVAPGGAGIRAQYWEFDQSVDTEWTDTLGQTEFIALVHGRLACRTIDLEATKQIDFASWRSTFFAGARYGEISQFEEVNDEVVTQR